MIYGVTYTSIFGNALVAEVYFAVGRDRYVFQKGVAAYGVVDIGFGFFAKVYYLGITSSLEVEYSLVVPAVFVVADKQTFGVGR